MAFWSRKGRSAPIEEAATDRALSGPPRNLPGPRGFEDGIPLGGTTVYNPGGMDSVSRPEFCSQLYGAYLSCPWASASIDTVARSVTAGGLELAPKSDPTDDALTPARVPSQVARLQSLLDFVNPRMDIRQLMRSIITDLLIFGDAFLEVVWLGGLPVALYPLDSPTMIPIADEHGTITHYTQALDPQRIAEFEPEEVIHFSLDAPRGGVYGVGAMQRCLLPVTAWLFTAGLLKETMRKGNPPRVHADHDSSMPDADVEKWQQRYTVRQLGIANIGRPITTKGGGKITQLSENQIAELLATLTQKRDEIIASIGVPPRKLGIAESGQLGGTGEGTSQDKTFRVNTCGPIAELVLEKLNFDLTVSAFGITDWEARFGEVDWRDDKVVEDIRDMRLRNGSWVLNRYRAEIGEPPVDGGDDPILVDRQNLVIWSDIAPLSHAAAKAAEAGADLAASGVVGSPTPGVADPAGAVPGSKPKKAKKDDPEEGDDLGADVLTEALTARARALRLPTEEEAALSESWAREYQQRRKRALRESRAEAPA